MATFIKGLTDQFGPMQLYRPDYQFLTQVYGTRQAEYDRGFNMVRNLYNSVLNSSLTNGDNQTFRQEAFKKLQGALKSVSNVDLSNQTNIMRAQSLIDPISQDQDLAYDMAVTKFHQAQKQKMDQYKNSTDPKMRAMYNEYSKMDIAFAEEDLRNAKRGDGSVQKIQPREFVPFEDTMEYLRKAAKEQGLEITQSGPDGKGYIIKTVNGAGVAPIFSEWARATMGNRFDRQFQVMGRVAAESAIRNEMGENKISREEAIQKISQKLLPTLNEKVSTEGIEADAEIKRLDSSIELYEKKYPNGFPPSEPQIKENYQKLLEQREQRKGTLENSRGEVAKMQQEGPQYIASNLYSVFTNEARDRAAVSFGNTFATTKQSVEYRPDTTWATKANIASRERVAAANLQFKYKDLDFRQQKFAVETELKTIALKGKGYIPSEEYLGSGLGTPQSGAELVSKGMQQNREKAQLTAFNAQNGLALLVLNEDAKKYGELQGAISKLQAFAGGSNKQLSGAEWQAINNYARQVGINATIPKGKGAATAFLDQLAGATYNTATKKLAEYSRMHKTGDSQKFVQAFTDASNAFKGLTSERENLNKNMLRLSQEVVDANGNVKPAYKGAVVRGRLATGGYDIDYSRVNPAAKARLDQLVTSEYSSRTRPVTNNYNFSKLNAAEVDVLIKNPYAVKSITASDGTSIDVNVLKNLNASDLAELFGDQARVFYDGKSAQVQLNLSQKTEISKKLGIKGAGTLTFDLPYESITSNSALSRFAKYVGPNSVSSQSLGVLDDFLSNPSARVLGQDSHLGYGFDYSVTGTKDAQGRPALMFTMDFYNPATKKNESMTQLRSFTPGDANSLIEANQYINGVFDNYIQSRIGYEQNQK
jgi:hypothetical protein